MADRIDRYEIVRKLATGGMADVFLALQWGDGGFVREVVVKRLHPHIASEPNLLEDFRNEAHLLARLGGAGIPHVHEFRCSSNDEWYLAMEHVRGPTIAELVQQATTATRLPLNVALTIGAALCRILDDVHDCVDLSTGSELGVVHGDLTPSNVVADMHGRVHLLDFGIAGSNAHRKSRMGGNHGIRGTVGYFAPEAAQSSDLPDRRADLFSMGVLLYELVTGEEAFTRVAIEYMNVIRVGPAVRPCEVDGSLPPALDELLMRCLSPEPGDRPARAGDIADAIEAVAAAEDLSIGPSVLVDHVHTFFPKQDPPARIGAPERGFVVPFPVVAEVPDGMALSADERDELLADLALFAPDGAAFLDAGPAIAHPPTSPPAGPPSPSPRPSPPPPPRPSPPPPPPSDRAVPMSKASPPRDRVPRGEKTTPPSDRTVRLEKITPVALPAVHDIASSVPPDRPLKAPSYPAVPAKKKSSRPARKPESSRRPQSVHPDSDESIEVKNSSDDTDGFYIYVAEED